MQQPVELHDFAQLVLRTATPAAKHSIDGALGFKLNQELPVDRWMRQCGAPDIQLDRIIDRAIQFNPGPTS
jgi:hypothetical protein